MEKKNICGEIRITSNLIRRKTFSFEGFDNISSILGSQGYIIKYLADNKDSDIYQKDIEKKFKVRRSTVTSAINRMEKGGLVVRESVERDNRLKRINLTDKGWCVHMKIEKEIKKTEAQILKALTKEEVEVFYNIIKKMQSTIED